MFKWFVSVLEIDRYLSLSLLILCSIIIKRKKRKTKQKKSNDNFKTCSARDGLVINLKKKKKTVQGLCKFFTYTSLSQSLIPLNPVLFTFTAGNAVFSCYIVHLQFNWNFSTFHRWKLNKLWLEICRNVFWTFWDVFQYDTTDSLRDIAV